MKIFISHSSQDYQLAKTLKNLLKKSKLIKEVFVYEDKKKFGIQISEKITNEINSSDYLVALITKNSIQSASVNQEYGYAQAKNLQKIPFLEEGSEEGIMIFGTEKISFSKENFLEKCLDVKKYLLDNGIPNKISKEEEIFIQKSSHYRYGLEQNLASFIDSYLVYFVKEYANHRGMFTNEKRVKGQQLFKNEIKTQNEFFDKIYDQSMLFITGIYEKSFRFKSNLELLNRFPHDDFLPDEQDALIKLNERIAEVLVEDDLITYLQSEIKTHLDLNTTLHDTIMNNLQVTNIRESVSVYLMEFRFFLKAIENMFEILQNIHTKYGVLSFRDSYDDEIA